jgi:hypothetical protein
VAPQTTGGGSVPAHLRNAFLELIEEDRQGAAACELAAQLVQCTDVLPYEYCDMLGLSPGCTFGQAALRFRATLGCQP